MKTYTGTSSRKTPHSPETSPDPGQVRTLPEDWFLNFADFFFLTRRFGKYLEGFSFFHSGIFFPSLFINLFSGFVSAQPGH